MGLMGSRNRRAGNLVSVTDRDYVCDRGNTKTSPCRGVRDERWADPEELE